MIYSRTTKKLIFPLLLLSIVFAGCTKTTKTLTTQLTTTITNEQTAIETIKNTYTELQDYPSDNFPLRSISTQQADNGWYVAFIQEGSGRPIISARCFFVDANNNVTNNGEYIPTPADDSVQKFSAKTCAPLFPQGPGPIINPPANNPPSEVSTDPIKACTMEARMCPDGSAVGRSGPNCEFAPCPGE